MGSRTALKMNTRNQQHKRLFTDWFYRPKKEPNHKKEKEYKKPTKQELERELLSLQDDQDPK